MKIVNESNRAKIQEKLDEAQKRCRSYTVDFDDILEMIENVEKRLKDILPVKYWNGVRFKYAPIMELPRSYKYIKDCKATNYDIYYTKGKWRIDLDSICRASAGIEYGQDRDGQLIFTPEQKEEVLKRQLAKISTI